jgi:Beta-ketoacyl synthase, N-terminal domain
VSACLAVHRSCEQADLVHGASARIMACPRATLVHAGSARVTACRHATLVHGAFARFTENWPAALACEGPVYVVRYRLMRGAAGTLFIEGIAFWSSRMPGWPVARAILRGEADAPETSSARPAPPLLAPTERRRAPDTVAVALEVAARACENAGRDPKTLPSVFASTHGDLAISDYMCDTLAKTPALTSPTKFHNSVHNAAAGYWTIGTGCLEPYTAISAYQHTFGQGLLECASQCTSDDSAVLYVAYDIEARGPLATMAPSKGLLGGALVLTPGPTSHGIAQLHWAVRAVQATAPTTRPPMAISVTAEAESTPPRPQNAALVEGNAMASCLTLFEALADGAGRDLAYTLSSHLMLDLRLEPL